MLTELEQALLNLTREGWLENSLRHEELTRQLNELTVRLEVLTKLYANLAASLSEE